MVKTDAQRIDSRIAVIDARLAEVPALQVERNRLLIAREVIASLPPDDTDQPLAAPVSAAVPQVGEPSTASAAPEGKARVQPSTRTLIQFELTDTPSLTRADLVTRLRALGYDVNENTVSSTLSNMVRAGALMKGKGHRYSLNQPSQVSDPLPKIDDQFSNAEEQEESVSTDERS